MRAIFPASTRRRACLLGACVSLTTLVACGDTKPKGEGPYAELVAEFVPLVAYSTVTSLVCAAESVTGMLTFVTLSKPDELGALKATVAGAVSLSVTYIIALTPRE